MNADKTSIARLDETALRCAKTGRTCYTRFLDPAEMQLALAAARRARVEVKTWGGYPEAERGVAAFWEGGPPPEDWPFCCLHARWEARYASLSHRDVLGALMGLGMIRETIGDIIVQDGHIYVFVLEEMADYVAANLTKAGSATLHFKRLSEMPAIPPPGGVLFRDTVASLRLDAVLAAAYRLTRAEAAAVIREGKVRVDFIEETRPDALLSANALLSVRGMGRVRLKQVDGPTKKGRIAIALFRYV